MRKFNLTSIDAFLESLLSSVGAEVRAFILSRPRNDIQRMYQRALTAAAMRNLHPRSRYHVQVELCAQDDSLALSTWWEAFLILAQDYWGAWLEEEERLRMVLLQNVNSCAEPVEPGTDSNLPPPQELFIPVPKTETGGCARSDSLIRSLIF